MIIIVIIMVINAIHDADNYDTDNNHNNNANAAIFLIRPVAHYIRTFDSDRHRVRAEPTPPVCVLDSTPLKTVMKS